MQLSDCAAVTLRFTLKHAAAPAGSVRAWRGAQARHVKAILTSGRLRESTPATGRTLYRRDGSALSGVYLHGDKLSHKALWYANWASPRADGLFWKCYFEVRAAPAGRVLVGRRRTDQPIYAADCHFDGAVGVSAADPQHSQWRGCLRVLECSGRDCRCSSALHFRQWFISEHRPLSDASRVCFSASRLKLLAGNLHSSAKSCSPTCGCL